MDRREDVVVIIHPLVASSEMTCDASPEQYHGTLIDGRFFYFRYRFGKARLGIGRTLIEAAEDAIATPGIRVGDPLDGHFDSVEQRDRIFAEIISDRLAPSGCELPYEP